MTETAATSEPCALHVTHSPLNKTIEFHHIIPVAWQLKTSVASPPFPGVDPDGRGELWDARGVWCCPTGHRNVHHWIVAMMEWVKAYSITDPANAIPGRSRSTQEAVWAIQALTRYEPYGALAVLARDGELGQS